MYRAERERIVAIEMLKLERRLARERAERADRERRRQMEREGAGQR